MMPKSLTAQLMAGIVPMVNRDGTACFNAEITNFV
jgi:hypothetical protein